MTYAQDISRCLEETIGSGGIGRDALDAALEKTGPVLDGLRARHEDGTLPLLRLPGRSDDLETCRQAIETLLRGARDVVVFGTGGSSLGGQALVQLAGWRTPGPAALPGAEERYLHFFDNLDGPSLQTALERFDLKATRFIVISKSGNTPETLVQTLAALEALKAAGLEWNLAQHLLAVTEPGDGERNALRRLMTYHDVPVLEHDPKIGGRYSVLSAVGMLPALVAGLDVEALRMGAADVLAPILEGHPPGNVAPAVGAAVNLALAEERNVNAVVMMPYADRLRLFSNWFVQLWAESLGKNGGGSLPVAAAGPVDQHSILQLFLDGPADKLFNIVSWPSAGEGPRVPAELRNDSLVGYLAGRAIGDLTDCQQRATAETLARRGRPVRVIALERLDERSLGALLMHFMLETIIMGGLMGVDPFDQPAVEESKVLTREYLAMM